VVNSWPPRGRASDVDIAVDEATIREMVSAYRTCQTECASIQRAVDANRARLAAHWHSDQAAAAFGSALDQWLAGFDRVRRGLDMLDAAMQRYARVTATTEEGNAAQAGQWPTA
jgi:uncharacterized protein YukE